MEKGRKQPFGRLRYLVLLNAARWAGFDVQDGDALVVEGLNFEALAASIAEGEVN